MSEAPIKRNEAKADNILQESLNIEKDASTTAVDVVTFFQKHAYDQGKKLAMEGKANVDEFIKFFGKGINDYRKALNESKTNGDSEDLIEIAQEFC